MVTFEPAFDDTHYKTSPFIMSRSCIFCCFAKKPKPSKSAVNSPPESPPTQGDSSCHTVELSVQERNLIKKSAQLIFHEKHLEQKGVAFLISFFKAYPHNQRYFKAFRGLPPDELKSLPRLQNHGRRVMDQMALLVQNIDEPSLVNRQLSELVLSHRSRRVKPRNMKDMLEMFVVFAKQEIGPEFTAQHEEAWRRMNAYIRCIMDEAAEKGVAVSTTSINNGTIFTDDLDWDVDGNVNATTSEEGDGANGKAVTENDDDKEDDGDDDDEVDITKEGSGDNVSVGHVAEAEQNGGGDRAS